MDNGRKAQGPYFFQDVEPDWIRDGEPIEFAGERWYPQDDVETLTDSEMLLIGEYRGVEFFIEKIDIKPYNRLYTKFDEYRFRLFEKREPND